MATQSRLEDDHARQDRRGIIVLLLIVAAAWVGSLYYLYSTYQTQTALVDEAAHSQLQQRTQILALMQTELLSLQLEQADNALRVIREYLDSAPRADGSPFPPALDRLMSHQRDADPEILDILITDTTGQVVRWTNSASAPDVGDRAYFQAQREATEDRPFVSMPLNPRLPEPDSLIAISRPWYDTNGDFAGVIALGLDIQRLTSALSVAAINDEIITLVAHDNHDILMVAPYQEVEPGYKMDYLQQHGALTPQGETLYRSRVDGKTRMAAWHHLPQWGLYVFVAEDISPMQSDIGAFREQARRLFIAIAIAATVLLALLVWLLIRRTSYVRNLRLREAALTASEKRNRAIVNAIPDLMFTLDAEGRVLDYQAGNGIPINRTPQEFLGHPVTDLLPSRLAPTVRRCIRNALASGQAEAFEYSVQRDHRAYYYQARTVRYSDGKALMIIIDITAQKDAELALQWRVNHDSLTELPNRVLFYDRISNALAQYRRYKRPFALLYMDLNGFKQVNDRLGHNAGDQLLYQVARRLAERVRAADTLARLAGDEFAVIATECDGASAEVLANKLRSVFTTPFNLDGKPVNIDTSVGIALCPDDAQDADTLVKAADRAMYRDKDRQKNS